jgi:hypothetical protein
MTNKVLSRDDILNANDIYIQELHVPEWGGILYVKTLNGEERDKVEAAVMQVGINGQPQKIKLDKLRSTVASLGICDKDGKSLFTEKDIPLLAKKSAAALDRVVAKIQTLSGMSPADIESLVGELKNGQPAALRSD